MTCKQVALRVLVGGIVASGFACSVSDDTTDATAVVDTLATGQIVTYNAAVTATSGGPAVRVIEDLRIGQADGDGPGVFGRITSFDIDDTGRRWILDGLAQHVQIFDASGAHVKAIGRWRERTW